jgi:hypothetical protein
MLDTSTYRRAVMAAYCQCLQGMNEPMTIFDDLNSEGGLTHQIESRRVDNINPDQAGLVFASMALCKVLVALAEPQAIEAAINRVLLTLGPTLNFEWLRVADDQVSVVEKSDTIADAASVIGLAFWWINHKVERQKISAYLAKTALTKIVRTCLKAEPDFYFKERFPEFMETLWLEEAEKPTWAR